MLDVWADFAFRVNWFTLGQSLRSLRKRKDKKMKIYPCWFYAETTNVMEFQE